MLLLLFLLQDAEECQLATSAAGTPCQVICIQYVEWRYIVLHLEIHACCVLKKRLTVTTDHGAVVVFQTVYGVHTRVQVHRLHTLRL